MLRKTEPCCTGRAHVDVVRQRTAINDEQLRTSFTCGFFEAESVCSSFSKKSQNVATLQSLAKKPGHKQRMHIRRPPEVASKTVSPVRQEARWTISPEQIDCQKHFLFVEKNTPVNMLS